MSSHERDLASLLYRLALSYDGAVLGAALAYTAIRTLLGFRSTSKALRRVRSAPSFNVSDLRVLRDSDRSEPFDQDQQDRLVVVRGQVEVKSAVDGKNWKNLTNSNGVLVSPESGDKAVIIQRTQTVPFVLVEGGWLPSPDYVIVNMDGSEHPLPLTTVYHRLQPIDVSPHTFLQAIFGHECPVGVLDEEKVLPLGKNISAIGICDFKMEFLRSKLARIFPIFCVCLPNVCTSMLSFCGGFDFNGITGVMAFCRTEMTKDQVEVDLADKTKILFWSGIVIGSLSIGILGYSIFRNWNRWKEYRRQRQLQQPSRAPSSDADSLVGEDEEVAGDIPDGQLCVICLMRRRTSAFNPCGHLVCCYRCAISVEREVSPKCPICRVVIRGSMRIYSS
ncbi:hypothetical protein JRO89_XS09G0230600 [Xanthoceras sorbifolium]|uniref:RING-type E3 ubiquitin transferase n=1 Tax=Xanthoceras sorbifolium TaxID=99658 RepID=A0ABQ8HMK0_9ROSI|nr:hypothetical protein JRO89_XS09G0230600 [Xanthoceras sorbifolium]